MTIADVWLLATRSAAAERAIADAAEAALARATEAGRRAALEQAAVGARTRRLLWESRRPDTGYIGTGRSPEFALGEPAPLQVTAPAAGNADLAAALSDLAATYRTALAEVDQHLDEPSWWLLTNSISGIDGDLALLTSTS